MNTKTQTVAGERTAAREYPDMSPRTLIQSDEDKEWLRETHGITGDFELAMIFGNEDCPSRVETFAVNHYQCPPIVWIMGINGKLTEQV
jgi:hypothetical protein